MDAKQIKAVQDYRLNQAQSVLSMLTNIPIETFMSWSMDKQVKEALKLKPGSVEDFDTVAHKLGFLGDETFEARIMLTFHKLQTGTITQVCQELKAKGLEVRINDQEDPNTVIVLAKGDLKTSEQQWALNLMQKYPPYNPTQN